MGIEQTAFYTKDASTSGTVVGMFPPKPKTHQDRLTRKKERRTQQPIDSNLKKDRISEVTNENLVGFLLDY
jgi:hypothetical protein